MNARQSAFAFLTLALLALPAAGAGAQQLEGVALGPDGQPLADQPVLLHRVDASGGALAATDTTDANGQFSFQLDGNDQSAYFAALRFDDEIYIGPPAQGDQDIGDYVLEVSPSASISAMTGGMTGGGMPPAQNPTTMPPSGESSDLGALWLVALLAVGAAAAFVFTAPRYRRRRTREALVELGTLENRLVGDDLSDAERKRLAARRARLKEQLAPPA